MHDARFAKSMAITDRWRLMPFQVAFCAGVPSDQGSTMVRIIVAALIGLLLTPLTTFVVERSATATYPDIMGCESGCVVTATGWPLVFVRDYTGMSVINRADILEVWIAGDRFDWLPFLLNVVFWSAICLALGSLSRRIARARS